MGGSQIQSDGGAGGTSATGGSASGGQGSGGSGAGGASATGGSASGGQGAGGAGGASATGGSASGGQGGGGAGGASATGGSASGGQGGGGTGGVRATGGSASGGNTSTGGSVVRGTGGSASGGAGTGGSGGSAAGGNTGTGGTSATTHPGDVAKAAGTPMVAAHALTRALFASYQGPLFKALRVSDKKEQDIGPVAAGGIVDTKALDAFCAGTTCKLATLYDQSGNGNDMWRGDTADNAPGPDAVPILCQLLDIEYWQMSDGTKVPLALGRGWNPGEEWTRTSQCLRNRDKTKNMPTGSKPQTTYGIFHQKYVNPGCCFNYGNTGNLIHYSGPGTLSALNFSKVAYWSKGTGTGPWVMVDWETGVYAGNIAKCGSGAASPECTSTGVNENPTVTHDLVTAWFKHDGVAHWQLKAGNAKSGPLAVSIDLPTLPKGGYSPLKQEGGLGLGEGGAGDKGGSGGFSEGAVMAGETTDATDDAIQKSIVSIYGL